VDGARQHPGERIGGVTAEQNAEAEKAARKIIIGTTLPAMAMGDPDAWSSWLMHADRQRMFAADAGYEVQHFAAVQVDGRGEAPFAPLYERLGELGGHWWTYSLDDGRDRITMTNRWRHITFGQNLVVERCQADPSVEWLLFLAADCAASSDVFPRMLEMQHPLVAPYITTYGLRGPAVEGYPFPVEDAMASAAALFVHRSVFRRIRFRWDLDEQMSDDPCFHADARDLLGVPTYVRTDVLARHYPEAVGDYESRGYDTAVVR
jgi:hypothetical protein